MFTIQIDEIAATGPATAEVVYLRSFSTGATLRVVRTLEAMSRIRADRSADVAYRFAATVEAPGLLASPDSGEYETASGFETIEAAVAWIDEEMQAITRLRGALWIDLHFGTEIAAPGSMEA